MIKGKNLTLLDVKYIKPNKKTGQKECFQVIYKTEDGTVKFTEEEALVDVYIVKPEFRNYNFNKPQERMDVMDKHTILYSNILRLIEKESGDWGKNIVNIARAENNWSILNELYRWPFAYRCDFQPEFYFYDRWYKEHNLDNVKLTKSYLDIEIDQIDYTIDLSDIKNTAYAPVNVVTVIIEETSEVYTFILKPYKPNTRDEKRIKMYEKQLADHNHMMNNLDDYIKSLNNEYDPVYGHLEYKIKEYEKEIDLIVAIFSLLNRKKPNFCLMWNMRFDIQYLYYRSKALGYEPYSFMCHRDFPNPTCYFKEDSRTFKLEKQFDFFYCSSYTQYICQLRNYASIRKSQHKARSFKLNDVADHVLRDKKVEYPNESNITTFVYNDWPLFIKYNIKDTLLQKGIEGKNNDVMTYYMRAHSNITPYNKIFRETHLLRNVREKYFNKEGWVQSNNINILNKNNKNDSFYGTEDDEETSNGKSFKGAIVGDPLMNDNVGEDILGVKSNTIFKNAIDFDMGAFYPSIKIACNMDASTLLFKASFNNQEFKSGEYSNKSLNQEYTYLDKEGNTCELDITGEAVNTYASKDNLLTFAYGYLNFPSVSEMYELIMKRLKE